MKPLGYVMISCLGTAAVIGMAVLMMTANVGDGVIVEHRHMREVKLPGIGDAAPGAGKSGWLYAYLVLHDHFTYTDNITINGSVLASGDVNNSHLGSNVNYSTAFDFVVKVRWNQTHAFRAANTTWMHSWVEGWFNCSTLSVASLECTEYNITGCNNENYVWMHYVADNSGNGYTISQGQNLTSFAWNFNAYY